MDLGWQFDNPVIALGKYYEDSQTFITVKTENDALEKELSSKQDELSDKHNKLQKNKIELSSMGTYVAGNIETVIQNVTNDARNMIDKEEKKFNSQKNDLLNQKEKDLQENDGWLENRLQQLLSDNSDLDRGLSELEEKALEFESLRRKYVIASNDRINEYQDTIVQEQLDCETVEGELAGKQDEIFAKYEPDVTKYKKIIDDIYRKHQPEVDKHQSYLDEKITECNEEVGRLQEEKEAEVQRINNVIGNYQRAYQQEEKDFDAKIMVAKLRKQNTSWIEQSKITRLNTIKNNIQMENSQADRDIARIDRKINAAQSKYAKITEKAEEQLNSAIRDRDNELADPMEAYNTLLNERNGQIDALQAQIDQRRNESNYKVNTLNNNIASERIAQENNSADIDQQIIAFIMDRETCLSEVLDEENAPFIALQRRIDVWMKMLSTILKEKMTDTYQAEHEKQKRLLVSKSYAELQSELTEASQYKDQLSFFAKNKDILTIAGGISAVSGIMLIIVVYAMLKMTAGLAGIPVMAAGAFIIVSTVLRTRKEISSICKYVSLASDYREFPGIAEHSTQVTQERELAKMRALGNKLYDVHYGRTEAQNIHDAKDADIKADCERNLKLITREFENKKAEIEREKNMKVQQIEMDAAAGEVKFNAQKEKIQSDIRALTRQVGKLEGQIANLSKKKEENDQFIDAFEANYSQLEKKLNESSWIAPREYGPEGEDGTKGKLSNVLYIIPENEEKDECNHRKMYKIEHEKKALVVNYDISGSRNGDVYQVEQINKIIHDLMYDLLYAMYRMNSKESYKQFIVDEMACTNDLKSTVAKNAFNIVEVAGKLEDIRERVKSFSAQKDRIAEMGTSIDALNESKFKSGDRPETYNILYIIFKPNERKNKLDDDIRRLIPECDKYGFFPVFICEKDTWEREVQEKESIYKDIRSLTNNSIVVFDGRTYNIAV